MTSGQPPSPLAAVEQIEEALHESEAQYASLVQHLPMHVVRKDLEGRYTFVSRSLCQMLGRNAADLLGKTAFDVYPREVAAEYVRRDRQVVETGQAHEDLEEIRAGDEVRYHQVFRIPVRSGGRIVGTQVVFWDVTERRRAEEALRRAHEELNRYTARLERSNQELQQFAYIASHDLREPLRTITSFCDLLVRHYQGQLDEQAQRWMDFIVDSTRQMQRLIDDLLTYSRVDSRAKPPKEVDTGEVVEDVLAALKTSIEETGAVITRDALPTLVFDPTHLRQLLQNLVSNAITYHADRTPTVHLSARHDGEQWVIAVQDNGIGIKPEFQERIFEIFKRLHSRSEYPGTGMGLAICRKIVELRGGRIWVESEPGRGSTFYFTVPTRGPGTP